MLLRAGMIHQVAAGVYAYLPLAWRSLRKIEAIVRDEMDAAGAQELMLPALQPLELWEESGRAAALGDTLFRLTDRRQRPLCLAPTHEEVITQIARHHIRSYRDLPLNVYQIQTKFRDEPRPRGGLIRVREFDMKDAYSFDADDDGLDASYQRMMRAYQNIYDRCGLETVVVEADSGAIGGKDSHEFLVVTPSGEDEIMSCTACGYAANRERAAFTKRPFPAAEPQPLAEVATPGIKTIADLARFLDINPAQTLKAVFYACDGEVVFVNIRGDLGVNEVKLKNLLQCHELRLATDAEVAAAGLEAGYASPVGLAGIRRIADDSILLSGNFVAGANRPDHHLVNVNYRRDFAVDAIADIALAQVGDACPRCGGPEPFGLEASGRRRSEWGGALQLRRGIEVGHVFKLGTVYSSLAGATFLDRDGVARPLVMGCYGIGIGRLLAAAIEQHHDEHGIVFPAAIAPYEVYLCAIAANEPEVAATADRLYEELSDAGIEVLYDDRPETPGVKLHDADLLGMPLRVVVSPRSLRAGGAEVKARSAAPADVVPLADVLPRLQSALSKQRPMT